MRGSVLLLAGVALNEDGKTFAGMGVDIADFNNDGWPDVYVACDSTPSWLFRNQHDGTFAQEGLEHGVALSEDGLEQAGMGVAVADYDLDGSLDIFKTHFSDDTNTLYRNDGKGYYPFTADCARFENGIVTTTNCKQQFENSLKGVVSRIRDRRFVAVDRERGIVFAFAFFDHNNINWTWQLGELFKIENGQIRRVEAVFHRAPYGIPSGWSSFEQAMSESIQSVR